MPGVPSATPAHANNASTCPLHSSTAASIDAASARSRWTAFTPDSVTSAKSITTTSAPASWTSSAVAAPMPLAPPTTSARLPSYRKASKSAISLSRQLVELPSVVAEHPALLGFGHANHRLLDDPPAVRPVVPVVWVVVRPHQIVDADPVPDRHRERLANERDLDVSPEVVAREHRELRARPRAVAPPVVVHVLEERGDPPGPDLRSDNAETREPVEHLRVDEARHPVGRLRDCAAHRLEVRQLREELRHALTRDLACLARLPAPGQFQPDVDVDRHLLLLGGGPERVVLVGEVGVP